MRTFLRSLHIHFYEKGDGKDENDDISKSVYTRCEEVHCHHVPATLVTRKS